MASRTGEPSPPKRVTVKVVILGCMNVGKTSLMKRYASNKFTGKRQVTTGTDFVTKSVELNGQPVRLQLWDTAGQERFAKGTLGNSFYRGTDGALLVYDLNSQHTFDQVNLWREELLSKMGDDIDPRTFPVVVVGNKLDILEDRARAAAEAKAKAAAEAKTAEEGGDAGGDDGDSETKATTPRSEGGGQRHPEAFLRATAPATARPPWIENSPRSGAPGWTSGTSMRAPRMGLEYRRPWKRSRCWQSVSGSGARKPRKGRPGRAAARLLRGFPRRAALQPPELRRK